MLNNGEKIGEEMTRIMNQKLIDVDKFIKDIKQCAMLNKKSESIILELLNTQPIVENRMFGRDSEGRCRLRGCNLCDNRSEQLQKKWTPCFSKLPDIDGSYEVTIKRKDGKSVVDISEFRKKPKFKIGKDTHWNKKHVIAWRRLTEPYMSF